MNEIKQSISFQQLSKANLISINEKSSPQQYACRICLQQMRLEEIFYPCECRGSSSQIHEECLMLWAQKSKHHMQSKNQHYIVCDLCKSKIFIDLARTYRCMSREELSRSFTRKDTLCIVASVLFLVLGLVTLGMIIYQSTNVNNQASLIIYAVGLSITITIIIVTIIIYIYHFLMKKQSLVTGIHKKYKNIKMVQGKITSETLSKLQINSNSLEESTFT